MTHTGGIVVSGPGWTDNDGNGTPGQDWSRSSIVMPAGRYATWTSLLDGVGMTSEQSIRSLALKPTIAMRCMTDSNLATMPARSASEGWAMSCAQKQSSDLLTNDCHSQAVRLSLVSSQ